MEEKKKSKITWWLEVARIILATLAGILGGNMPT